MYLEYADYQNMGGTLEETAFNDLEYEAETIVNWYTFNRLKDETDYPAELSRCMYRLITLLKLKLDALTMGAQTTTTDDGEGHVTTVTTSPFISGQSNDGVSIQYNAIDADALFGKFGLDKRGNEFEEVIFRYLNGVRNSQNKRLTYRGLYPDE